MAVQLRVDMEKRARLAEGMPSLQSVGSLREKRYLANILRVHQMPHPKGAQLADGLVARIDKAVEEYGASREALFRFFDNGGHVRDLHRAGDHFESCVSALHRAVNYLRKLSALRIRVDGSRPFVPPQRDLEPLTEQVTKQLRAFRDALEHIELDIERERLPADLPTSITLCTEGATVGAAWLNYRDVARWCEKLHAFALPYCQVTASVGAAPDRREAVQALAHVLHRVAYVRQAAAGT
jgi:hypothetical protein